MGKIIVTGANGFIGTKLVKELTDHDMEVLAVVRDVNSNIERIKNLPRIRLIYCDFQDIARLEKLVVDRDIDACIHLAWAGSSGDARADFALQLNNVKHTLTLVDTLFAMNVKRFIGGGTLAEKDVLNYHFSDGATPNAVSIYGIAKIAAHFMSKAECVKLGMEHVWCQMAGTYGPGDKSSNFFNFAAGKMLRREPTAFTSGEQYYDFTYVTDIAHALYLATIKGKISSNYYIGSGHPQPLKDYITTIRNVIDPAIEPGLGKVPFNGISLAPESFSCSKLMKDTGYSASISFEDGAKETINWLKRLEVK